MPKPVRKTQATDAGYPTLEQYRCERRGFLKQLAWKGLGLGLAGGFLASCMQDLNGKNGVVTGADAFGVDSTGADTTPLSPDTYKPRPPDDPPELPYGGGAPFVPEPISLRLPSVDYASAYIKANGYLQFAVSCYTYEHWLAEYYVDHPEATLGMLRAVLAKYTCEELNTEWLTLKAELELALVEAYDGPQEAPVVEGLSLEIDYCETMDPFEGDMDEPQYP